MLRGGQLQIECEVLAVGGVFPKDVDVKGVGAPEPISLTSWVLPMTFAP